LRRTEFPQGQPFPGEWKVQVPTYELVLWFRGKEDVRITHQSASIGETLVIDNIRWLVEAQDLPRDPSATARYICSRRAATFANRSAGT
jgi:hypothetical protein